MTRYAVSRCTFRLMGKSQIHIRVAANRVRNTSRGLVFASTRLPWVSCQNV